MIDDPSTWFGDQVRVDVYRAGKDNAVRITHMPTGIAVTSAEDMSQLQNRRRAGRMLVEALATKVKNDSVD